MRTSENQLYEFDEARINQTPGVDWPACFHLHVTPTACKVMATQEAGTQKKVSIARDEYLGWRGLSVTSEDMMKGRIKFQSISS